MPQILFKLQQDPSLVRELARQFADKRGYFLRQRPGSFHEFAIERRDTTTALEIGDDEKYHYQRDSDDRNSVFLSVHVELTLPRQAQGTAVQLIFRGTRLDAELAEDLHSYLLNLGDAPSDGLEACPKCGAQVRAATARFCGKCGDALVVGEPAC